MAAPTHTVRFKGVTLGNLTAAEIVERLRAGELSLSHAVQHQGRWMTIRQFLQAQSPATPATPESGFLGRLTGRSATGDDAALMPPPPGANPVGDAIEGRVREGYLWCGLTFLLPVLLGLPVWTLGKLLDIRPYPINTLLVVAAIGGSGYAAWRAHRCARHLQSEGLDEVGDSMRQLALALAAAAACFWVAVALLWLPR